MKDSLRKLFQEVWFRYLFSIALVGLIAVAWLVYPTPYRFLYLNEGGDVSPVRVHRITGTTEILYSHGWEEIETEEIEPVTLQEVPANQLSALEIKGRLQFESLRVTVYNGSTWRIRELTVLVRVSGKGKVVLDRRYRLDNYVFCDPLETTLFSEDVGFELQPNQTWAFNVISARGQPTSQPPAKSAGGRANDWIAGGMLALIAGGIFVLSILLPILWGWIMHRSPQWVQTFFMYRED